MTDKHYIGEIGTQIVLDTGSALAGATNTKIKYRKPDGTTGEWTATIKETTKLAYTTIANDFNLTGMYRVQASLTLTGWTGLGEMASFMILDVFEG